MEKIPVACIILAAGKGTRMQSALPKVMHKIAGRTMIAHVLHNVSALAPVKLISVIAEDMKLVEQEVKKNFSTAEIAIQKEQLGTAHATKAAVQYLQNFSGITLILYGDTPLITAASLQKMISEIETSKAAVVVLGMRVSDHDNKYGRLLVDAKGNLQRIVEYKDATSQQREIELCNSGVMAISTDKLLRWLEMIENNNAKKEYYLTDIVAIATTEGEKCCVVEADAQELMGVNTRLELAQAYHILQNRLRHQAMLQGVTMIAPETVHISADIKFGCDIIIEPNVWLGDAVVVEDNVTIKAFSYLEGAVVKRGAVVGPYARLRAGTVIGEGCKIGNFVELKKAAVDTGAKISHLSYIGDAHIGEYANIGAGTITCNYDGYDKHHTDIGRYAFIGSNTALISPVVVGDGAIIGAGSVISEDVESDALSMTRVEQQHKQGWAKEFRRKKRN